MVLFKHFCSLTASVSIVSTLFVFILGWSVTVNGFTVICVQCLFQWSFTAQDFFRNQRSPALSFTYCSHTETWTAHCLFTVFLLVLFLIQDQYLPSSPWGSGLPHILQVQLCFLSVSIATSGMCTSCLSYCQENRERDRDRDREREREREREKERQRERERERQRERDRETEREIKERFLSLSHRYLS